MRLARGAVELKLEPLDLRHVIDDAVEQVAPQFHAKRQVVTIAQMPQPIVMQG